MLNLCSQEHRRGLPLLAIAEYKLLNGDVICFTDADCAPRSDWIARILEAFANELSAAVKARTPHDKRKLVARFVQLEYEDKYDLLRKQDRIDFIDTYSAAYRRQVLLANGGFDEQFTFLEDQELSFRLASRGLRDGISTGCSSLSLPQ